MRDEDFGFELEALMQFVDADESVRANDCDELIAGLDWVDGMSEEFQRAWENEVRHQLKLYTDNYKLKWVERTTTLSSPVLEVR